ncbi:alpha-amylase family protein [Flavobacterium restrictum]|uniref:Alpha amylase n=1 Tax=Flavobacterium restrictum TaxID=2594428 RepID=A0A553EB49_9FLAO|nr:alpha-amylase family protein [Flavobacterium restrictum]TRX42260.1 alpha amylase [Flavobacterium restrictum]
MQQAEKLSKLNVFLKSVKIKDKDFYLRLGANFPIITDLFQNLYANSPFKEEAFELLLQSLVANFEKRSALQKKRDLSRVAHPNWYSSEKIVGMMLYVDLFNIDINGLKAKIPYLLDLGINTIHLMPFLDVPEFENDGGYAVKNYREINPKFGTMADFEDLVQEMQRNDMNLVMDFVLNHCADQHQWAVEGRNGHPKYKDFFYFFPDRTLPNAYEQTMTDIFPDTSPGNFTYLPDSNQWVMTLFYGYQWDLNYKNPLVLVEMIDTMLFWSNKGIDIFRFDAVAYMWKEIGKYNQNLPEVHLLLQLFKLAGQIVAPGVGYIAEAIVAPDEIIKYFGEGLAQGDECDIAYNANFMALSWEALATRDTRLLKKSIQAIPKKPKNTTWINYARCHDDIGLGFSDQLVTELGRDSLQHRLYILKHYCDGFNGSFGLGERFMIEPQTGNARLSGSMAALCGLEKAVSVSNQKETELAIKRINLQHGIILSLGGLPMIYSGDEVALPNNYDYRNDETKKFDNRWLHRSAMNWNLINEKTTASPPAQVFAQLKKMIAIRKQTPAFADNNDIQFIDYENTHLLVFKKTAKTGEQIYVITNFSEFDTFFGKSVFLDDSIIKVFSLLTNSVIEIQEKNFISAYDVLWLKKQ